MASNWSFTGMLAATICAVGLGGCQRWFEKETLPNHPLFEHRKPIVGSPKKSVANDVGPLEPSPPQNPYFEAYRLSVDRDRSRPTQGTLTSQPKPSQPE